MSKIRGVICLILAISFPTILQLCLSPLLVYEQSLAISMTAVIASITLASVIFFKEYNKVHNLLELSKNDGVFKNSDSSQVSPNSGVELVESSFRERSHQLQSIFDNVQARFWIKDTKNNFIMVSRGVAEDFECEPEDLVGKNSCDVFPLYGDYYYKQDLEIIASGNPKLNIVEPRITKHGNAGWAQTDKFPYMNDKGEIEGILVVSQDITALIREEKLIESLYGAAIDTTVGIDAKISQVLKIITEYLKLDVALVSKIHNGVCEVLYGYSRDYNLENVVIPLEGTYCQKTFNSDEVIAEYQIKEERCILFENKNFDFCSYIGNHLTVGEHKWGTLCFGGGVLKEEVFTDREIAFIRLATQWVNQELTRHQYLDELQSSHINLVNIVDQLRESNENLEHFAYVASHDLQEPLRVILNFSSMFEKHCEGNLDEKAQCFLYYIRNGADRMKELIIDLLEYSSTQNKIDNYDNVDLDQVILDVKENLEQRISETNTVITSDKLPSIYANTVRISRLFQNLITNAMKYQEGDSIPEIHIGYIEASNEDIFFVKDNGIGINPEYYDQIFKPFKRLHNRSEYKGTGIGLAICKKIVEQVSGKIWVESEEGIGSSFYFSIPKNK